MKTILYNTFFDKQINNKQREIKYNGTIDDSCKYGYYKSDIRFIFKLVRSWSNNLKNPSYGLIVKAWKIEVKYKLNRSINNEPDFIDIKPLKQIKLEEYDISSDDENK